MVQVKVITFEHLQGKITLRLGAPGGKPILRHMVILTTAKGDQRTGHGCFGRMDECRRA